MSQHAAKRNSVSEGIPLPLASNQELLELKQELQSLIARRAFEIFEKRGGQHGHDVVDWLQAESEIRHGCRHEIVEQPDSFLLRAELPGNFTADQIKVSVEPHRVMVSGEKPISSLYMEGKTTQTKSDTRRIFRVHELPADVDPSLSKAMLNRETLEIVMPKRMVTGERVKTAAAVSPGK